MKYFHLSNGEQIPALGLGTWKSALKQYLNTDGAWGAVSDQGQ